MNIFHGSEKTSRCIANSSNYSIYSKVQTVLWAHIHDGHRTSCGCALYLRVYTNQSAAHAVSVTTHGAAAHQNTGEHGWCGCASVLRRTRVPRLRTVSKGITSLSAAHTFIGWHVFIGYAHGQTPVP